LGEPLANLINRQIVGRENLHLQPTWAQWMNPRIITKIPNANEEQPSANRAICDLLARPELRLDGAYA
jgi:hypothetical protein